MEQIRISRQLASALVEILQAAAAGDFEEAQLTLEDIDGAPVEIIIEGGLHE